ncbi:hypothetical protein Tco_0919249 [Tanacetum coccineum]
MYWKIIRVGNHTKVYQIFEDMLKNFDRDDLVKLWSLVDERFNLTEPTKDKERELWVELKRLSTEKSTYDFDVDEYSVMANELLRKIFIIANRPRQKFLTSVCWEEVGSRELASTDVVLATTEKIETIRERLKATQDRWKSYANNRRMPIEFNVGDFVMLKVSPWKGVLRFKNKGKFSPRFIGSFKILKRVGEVAYVLELPEEMKGIHNTFYVSYLRKCLMDEASAITLDDVEIDPEITAREEPGQF